MSPLDAISSQDPTFSRPKLTNYPPRQPVKDDRKNQMLSKFYFEPSNEIRIKKECKQDSTIFKCNQTSLRCNECQNKRFARIYPSLAQRTSPN